MLPRSRPLTPVSAEAGLRREAQRAHRLGDQRGGLGLVEAGFGVVQDALAELDDLVAVAIDRLAHRAFQFVPWSARLVSPSVPAMRASPMPADAGRDARDRGAPRRLPGRGDLQDIAAARPEARGGIGRRVIGWMSGFERQRMLSALVLLVIALFVAAGLPPAPHWRRELRIGAIVAFCAAVGWAVVEIAGCGGLADRAR